MKTQRIEKLTEAQIARFPEFVEKWTHIGLSTEPTNRAEAERGVRLAYAAANLPAPRIAWCDGPLSMVLAAAVTKSLTKNPAVYSAVDSAVRSADLREAWYATCWGQHWAGWQSWVAFMREVLGLESETEPMAGIRLITENAGWWIPYQGICWISDRHHVLNLDDRGRLHCETGPAVAYRDGLAIYAIHGTRVPPAVVEHPYTIQVSDIDAERNAEVRRVMVDRYGPDRYIRDSGATLVHQDDFGSLYLKSQPGDEDLCMVKVVNSTAEPDGSFKDYWLRVPPTMQTAKGAIAWTFGLKEADYTPTLQT